MRIAVAAALLPLLLAGTVRAEDAPAAASLDALNKQFALGDHVRFIAGEGNLPCADIHTPACTGRIYLQGAHVTAWQPAGEEPVLMMSSKSAYAAGKAFRGGIPVVFPWFAGKADDPKAPGHGVVRAETWSVESTREDGGNVILTFLTTSDAASKQWWPGDFELREVVTMGKELTIELKTKNTGTAPIHFEQALHAYFAVKDVEHVEILGLEGAAYLDKVDARKQKIQSGPITFTGETDRIYLATKGPYTIVDDSLHRRITLTKSNSATTVVWNPSASKPVADLGPEDWKHYVALETANLKEDSPGEMTAAPGETTTMSMRVQINH